MAPPYFSGATGISAGTPSPVRDLLSGYVPDAAWNALDRAGSYIGNKWKYGLTSDVDQPADPYAPPPITAPLPVASAPAATGRPSITDRFPTTAVDGAQRIATPDTPKKDEAARDTPRHTPTDAASFPGLSARAFSDTPDPWNPSGRARSSAQLLSDTNAHAMIEAAYAPQFARIAADAARMDPMAAAIGARKKTLEYEAMMPAGEEPVLRSSMAPRDLPAMAASHDAEGNPMYDAEQGQRGVTQAQALDFEKQVALAQAKAYDPKAAISIHSANARTQELAGIAAKRADLEAQVKAGKKTPAQFNAEMRNVIIDAASRGALLEGDTHGLAALLYPHLDANAAAEAALNSGPSADGSGGKAPGYSR